jgi:uncharacterized protein DUF4440
MMSSQNSAPKDDRKELEDIQQQLVRAWVTRDRSLIDRLLAPDWMVTLADGRVSTREEVLREFDTGGNRLLEGQVEDISVRTFDGFAIVTGRSRARGEYKGQKYDVTLRFTDVFVHRDQQWQAVASHATRVANEDSAAQKTGAND